MSGYGLTSAGTYANQAKSAIRPARRIRKEKKMKLSIKQRFRNWLMDTDDDYSLPMVSAMDHNELESTGMRFNLYKASGGYVIETRSYDERNDRNINKMYVINEEKDLGQELGKIITMESLR